MLFLSPKTWQKKKENIIFTVNGTVKENCKCLLSGVTVATGKRNNVERHFSTTTYLAAQYGQKKPVS